MQAIFFELKLVSPLIFILCMMFFKPGSYLNLKYIVLPVVGLVFGFILILMLLEVILKFIVIIINLFLEIDVPLYQLDKSCYIMLKIEYYVENIQEFYLKKDKFKHITWFWGLIIFFVVIHSLWLQVYKFLKNAVKLILAFVLGQAVKHLIFYGNYSFIILNSRMIISFHGISYDLFSLGESFFFFLLIIWTLVGLWRLFKINKNCIY